MKRNIQLIIIGSLLLTALNGCKESTLDVPTPPIVSVPVTVVGTLLVAPSPGNLSTVEHIKESGDYIVEVKRPSETSYTKVFVYKTDNYFSGRNPFNIGGRSQTAASFTNFSFSETSVDVRITSTFTAKSAIIRPLSDGVNFQLSGNVVTFSLTEPKKLSIEINGRTNPLFIFADAPDVPNTSATFYYPAGVHNIGKNKPIASGQSVYIAAGAVVEGSFNIAFGAQNVSIRGRGILSNGEWEFPTSLGYTDMQSASTIRNIGSNNTLIEGIMITNSTGWTLQMESYDGTITNAQYRNLKLINWNISTDGIWLDGINTIVDDCFIFNNDDMMTTHQSTNCKVTNMVLWGGAYGNMFMQMSFKSSNGIVYDNIDVIGKEDTHGAQLIEIINGGTRAISIDNVTFKNIRIENRKSTNSKFLGIEPKNQTLNNWLFENISIDGANADEGDIHGTATGLINNFTFRNLKLNGVKVNSLSEARIDINGFVSNVKFE
ncbi:MAG: hypothetical protein PF489_10925 [Salinivirgaceae bacterium]|jgi:hypothetical protein|nr:hypothetical protein [Salinivirgaceae bacterium]